MDGGGLRGLVGDKGPSGDMPIGDIGAKGGGAGVITGINGFERLNEEKRQK